MAYYAMERLRHTLTPEIEAETRRWDKAYHYMNHYFKQSNFNDTDKAKEVTEFSKTTNNFNSSAPFKETNATARQAIEQQRNCDYNDQAPDKTNPLYTNCFKTIKKVTNSFHIPNYAGYVPGMRTQNPFGKTFTKLAKEEIEHFDNRRANRNYDILLSKQWNYNPISKTYGEFFKTQRDFHSSRFQKTIINHPYTLRVRSTSMTGGADWKTPEIYNKRMLNRGMNPENPPKDYYFAKSQKFGRSSSS